MRRSRRRRTTPGATPTRYRDENAGPASRHAAPGPQPCTAPEAQRRHRRQRPQARRRPAARPAAPAATGSRGQAGTRTWRQRRQRGRPTARAAARRPRRKRTRETVQAAPPVIHQHYNGTVHQDGRTVNTTTRGVWARTNNQLPK
ncbi:hypothetical protein [Streptomyces sp. DHE17-7]|uniref:hypothetical protein n=1 Tax=Streptomyces sp. DHE17-7 TaxID=2759949 RepID=UPI0022EB56E4|nr:hypothetical protein [Streptomyces sp. DHE17-7]MBJ6623502.1 hypothetical protein [Streptomyces sp. DHE17-7]